MSEQERESRRARLAALRAAGVEAYPAIADGKVLFATTAASLLAVDLKSGNVAWEASTGLLARINRERRLTLVVSQHQLDTALEHGTRIVGFRAGRVVFDGPPAAVSPDVARTIYGETAA